MHENFETIECYINRMISHKPNKVNTNTISDGYHTFGELYEHRITLYMALCRLAYDIYPNEICPVWMSKTHSDGSVWPGWFILGIHEKPGKQITYHLPEDKWEECSQYARIYPKAPEFDGHSPLDVLNRLKNFLI